MESKLRLARKARGWSLAKAAEELCVLCEKIDGSYTVAVDYNTMGRWERGYYTPSPSYQGKLCLLYNASPDELGFSEGDDMKRRTALKLAGGLATVALAPGLFRSQVGAYEGTLTMAWDAYYTGGIQAIQSALTPWLTYLKERSEITTGVEKQEMQALLCRFLQLAGVVAREQGDMVSALSLADQAVLLAGHLKNADLVTTASIRKAATFAEQGGTDAAIMTLQAAVKAAKKAQDPSRCYLMMYLAKMYAQSPGNHHQRAQAFRLLDDVETTLRSKGQLTDDGSFMKIDQSGFFMLRGEVFRRYDQYDEAETSLKLVDKDLGLRWQGNLLVAKAELAQARNDKEAVTGYAQAALSIAERTGSATMKKKALAVL